jgi:serine/threonine-protein kinase
VQTVSPAGVVRPGRPAETIDLRPSAPGVFETIAASVGALPRVLLQDTDGGPEPPLHVPGGADADGSSGTRYRIDGEIARGGMGQVLRGRDPDLGRDVAIKVLREDFRDDAEMVRRFVEEAQIGGQLQHPGIVPIYEMGALGDRRPFFSMKLVKGDTLARIIAGRKDPRDGLPRLLSIFEAVAQTVAYTHARGVIHRDLKPSNVMVGAFGEVQVMDWGLAKVLRRGGVADDLGAGRIGREETIIATARIFRALGRSWELPPTWRPSRLGARSNGSTNAPTSSRWGRSSARSSPAFPPSWAATPARSSAKPLSAIQATR